MSDPDCPFCRTIAGEAAGRIIDQDDRTVAFMHAQPATRGHALVVPRRHARDLLEIADEDLAVQRTWRDRDEDLAATVDAARRLAARVIARLGADGVNVINGCGAAAWQTVAHFHIHVIPRYQGEGLSLAWRSGPGGCRRDHGPRRAAARVARGHGPPSRRLGLGWSRHRSSGKLRLRPGQICPKGGESPWPGRFPAFGSGPTRVRDVFI